ncbi:hypothetical protein ACOMHN_048532 [Nucella lapillus]
MSDPEAGDCEGPEDPQPEDEAHLSTFTTQDTGDLTLSQQSQQASGDTAEGTSSTPANEDMKNSPPSASQCALEEGAVPDLLSEAHVTNSAGCNQGGGEERREEEGQHTWHPESDRVCEDSEEGDTSMAAAREDAEVTNGTAAVCDGEVGVDVDQPEESAETQQSSAISVPPAVSSDHWDQEESPPEDELFTAHPSSAHEQDSVGSAVTEDDKDCACREDDHSSPTPVSRSDTETADLRQENSARSSSPSSSCVPAVWTDAVMEKEDDQVPECDRESHPHPSPQNSGDPADTSSYQAVSSGQAQSCESTSSDSQACARDSEHTDNSVNTSNVTVHSANSSDSPPPNQSGGPNIVDSPAAGACDNSSDCDKAPSQHSSISAQPNLPGSHRSEMSVSASQEREVVRKPYFLNDEDSEEEEELMTQLDAELHLRCSPQRQRLASGPVCSSLNGLKDMDMNKELCKQFEEQLLQLQETVLQREREINKLKDEKCRQREVSQVVIAERDRLKAELGILRDRNSDDLYLPQIKELEYTISQQQGEVRQLKEKLTTHDGAAKRAIATLQSEMKARIEQITKLYEECSREKDAMVVRFAESETKNIESKCVEDKMEARVRDMLKEKEFTNNKMRAAMAEKQKAVADLKVRTGEMAVIHKELEKLREEMSSADYRIKWHQNKLKSELDAHKETKVSLEKTTAKLKEAKEETEMIRKDCKAIVKTYQESEEVRSNSLDKELKMKQTELMIKVKEHSDTEEVHLKTKQELDVLKAHHKDTMEELKTLKDKVQCLEEERMQGEQLQNKYQTIIQNQKTENAFLSKQLAALQTLQEDFDRAQEMIKSLDSEVSSLKLANRDLQKDTEGCQARESKMLTLQSELSRTNALLRSENTSLKNQVATLSGEVQKMNMDIQDLDTRCRNMMDELEEESKKRQEETNSLSSQLAVKCKESEDYQQKWEDEIDASKTWKRKHTSNVKDLTRQLQQAKKRLEVHENGGGGGGGGGGSSERDVTSMGSRTNSNGSLNSMDNSNHHNTHPPHAAAPHHTTHPPNPQIRLSSQEPEFPVIREQVEVDKQLLIERFVKLQRSLARKNEKLDFVEEHIQQLVLEIKRKNRIIQGYVMREEAGTLASDTMDANKALLARKGGIMASVYSHHQQDGAMTLDLSLQINQKLQAVLEDTLLKNITLKENLDTLGEEIARLSQENRRLQLSLQGLESH